MNLIDKINKKQINPNVPEFRVGDTVRVDVKIKEGKRERIQAFEGVVTARKGGSVSETLSKTEITDIYEGYKITIEFDYDDTKYIDNILKDYEIIAKEYNNRIIYTFLIKKEDYNKIANLNIINKENILI